jgi:hypothetical protein
MKKLVEFCIIVVLLPVVIMTVTNIVNVCVVNPIGNMVSKKVQMMNFKRDAEKNLKDGESALIKDVDGTPMILLTKINGKLVVVKQ